MTSQDYIKCKHVRTWLLSCSFAKFQQFQSENIFFNSCLVLFLVFAGEVLICCFQNLCVQFSFRQGRESFFRIFSGLKLQTVSFLYPCFRNSSLFYTFSEMLILWKYALRIKAPRLLLTMSKPAETVRKQQMQRFLLLGWVFQRCYSNVSYISSRPFQIFITW